MTQNKELLFSLKSTFVKTQLMFVLGISKHICLLDNYSKFELPITEEMVQKCCTQKLIDHKRKENHD